MRLTEADIDAVLEESRNALVKAKISEDEAGEFLEAATGVLRDYRQCLGEDQEARYRIRKRFGRVELLLIIQGEKVDPFESGSEADDRSIHRKINTLQFEQSTTVSYLYSRGYNIVSVRSSRARESKNILKQPMFLAVVFGLVAGFLCQHLPANAASFIVDGLASPLLGVILGILAGVMGPIIFLSLVTAINTLESISELNNLGFKVFKRFVLIALSVTAISIAVAAFLFPVFGKGSTSFDPRMIVDLLLGVIPTSLITPFAENNVPQLVVLGICMGAALLMLGDRVDRLASLLEQVKEWVNELMGMMFKIMPLVPFLSVFKIVAQGNAGTLIMGWKYIAASYICLIICIAIKFVKVSVRCKMDIGTLWRVSKPIALASFTAGSEVVTLKMRQEAAERDLGIKRSFASFWIPMSHAMLAPSATIGFVLGPFLVAELTGTPVSAAFLLVLVILCVELSLASPGSTAGLATLFVSLGMSADYVGLFAAYDILVRNAAAAFGATYNMLEHVEAAYIMEAFDSDFQQGAEQV